MALRETRDTDKGKGEADMNKSKGDAYKEMGIEPWDVIINNFNPSAVRGYFIGETLAYLMRYNGDGNDRGGAKDLKKAQAFIERLIEYDEECSSSGPVRMGATPAVKDCSGVRYSDGAWRAADAGHPASGVGASGGSNRAFAAGAGGGCAGYNGPYPAYPADSPF